MDFFIAIVLIAFGGWIGWEVYKYLRDVRKPVVSGQMNAVHVTAPEQGVLPPVAPPATLNHEIIQHTYHKAYNGDLWPEWVCKCGGRNWVPTSQFSTLEKTQEKARKDGEAHVRNSNKSDALMAMTKDKFAW